MSGIRLYVEGGEDAAAGKAAVRQGFNAFLQDVRQRARQRRLSWDLVACGGRDAAFDRFMTAVKVYPHAFTALLVDAEAPYVSQTGPTTHLGQRDRWQFGGVTDDHCFLMVEMVEAWFLADRGALRRFYGRAFNEQALPGNPHVEQIPKADVTAALKAATRSTQKGEYHKIQHGPKLLSDLDISCVRAAAPNCDRLFTSLLQLIDRWNAGASRVR